MHESFNLKSYLLKIKSIKVFLRSNPKIDFP